MGLVEIRKKQDDVTKFLKKLKNAQNLSVGKLLDMVAEYGKTIAQSKWGANAIVTISKTESTRSIVAEGSQVCYIEFGTGIEGIGTYPTDKLPTQGIDITGGWVYYYDSPHKTTENGRQGWVHDGQFTVGMPAQSPMLESAEEIRKFIRYELPKRISEVLK